MTIKSYKKGDVYISNLGNPYKILEICEEPSILFKNMQTGDIQTMSLSRTKYEGLKLIWESGD